MERIQVSLTPDIILNHVAAKINEAMVLPNGDLAGLQPDATELAAIAIDALGDFGLIDGSYYAVVKHAQSFLEEIQA